MLESIIIDAFKAYGAPTEVPLRPFTLLVGPNGAGKSTILQAIDLLGGVVRSSLPEHLSAHGWEYGDLPHLRSGTTELAFTARLRLGGRVIDWEVALGKRRSPGIARERVIDQTDGTPVVLLERTGRKMWRVVQGGSGGREREEITQTLTSSWLAALDPGSAGDVRRFPVLCQVAGWARRIRGHFFLDPVKLRAPGRGDCDSIGPNGENLAPFLASLRRRRPSEFKDVLARVRRHYRRLESLEPRRAQFGWTQLEVEEQWNGDRARFNARQVSDGLLRLVAVAAMNASEPRSSVLLLDEIENGLHPRLLGQFTEMLQDLAPGTQVIATTHSPVAASYCKDDEGVVIVGRGQSGSPRCTPLTRTKGYARLRAHFDPGELWYNLGEEKLLR